MADTNYTELQSGTIIKATPIDGNPNAIGIITGTEEPFNKTFKNGITVQNNGDVQDTARIETDLIISGSIIYEDIYSYSGGAATLNQTNSYRYSTVLLISPTSGIVTIELPGPGSISGQSRLFIIKKLSSAGTVTINPNSSNTIDGAASVSATSQWSFCQVIYSGNTTDDYLIISNNGFS